MNGIVVLSYAIFCLMKAKELDHHITSRVTIIAGSGFMFTCYNSKIEHAYRKSFLVKLSLLKKGIELEREMTPFSVESLEALVRGAGVDGDRGSGSGSGGGDDISGELKNWLIPEDKMIFERALGAGGAGQTSIYRYGGHPVVSKTSFDMMMNGELGDIANELSVLMGMRSPNVVTLYGLYKTVCPWDDDRFSLSLVMDFVPHTLSTLLEKEKSLPGAVGLDTELGEAHYPKPTPTPNLNPDPNCIVEAYVHHMLNEIVDGMEYLHAR